jgi:acyl-CoA synthetase (NDP forming)
MPSAPFVTPARLRHFFSPRSIALLGASDRNNMSLRVHENLAFNGYQGTVHYVNPNTPVVHGQTTVPSLEAIEGDVDMLYVMYGGDRVVDAVTAAAERGTRNVVVLSAGFGETLDGIQRGRRLQQVATENEVVLLGPNTIGFASVTDSVVAYGSPGSGRPLPRGSVGVAAQSGVVLAATLGALEPRGAGFSTLAGVANEAVITLDHMIDYFVEDPATKVIGLFMETTRDPVAFRSAAARALAAGKPIVALTAGRTAVTADMAVSHTGAIVGDQMVKEAALEELGIISVRSLEEFLTTLTFIDRHGVMPGRRVAYISVSGGVCEMFADLAVEAGLEMPKYSPATLEKLSTILPSISTPKNPLDVTGIGQSDTNLVPSALKILSEDPNLDVVVFNDYFPPTEVDVDVDLAINDNKALGDVVRSSAKPILPAAMTFSEPPSCYRAIVEGSGKGYEIGGAAQGVLAIERSVWWRERSELAASRGGLPAAVTAPSSTPRITSREGDESVWTEVRSLQALEQAGIPVVPWRLCRTVDEVRAAASDLGYPLVAKVSSPDIAHKSRVGGVALDIHDEASALDAFESVRSAPAAAMPHAHIDGVLVTPMRTGGLDLIVGVKRDATWGLVLAVGLGGVWTEMLDDVALALLPTDAHIVREALDKLRGASLLDGGHGLAPADRDEVVRLILRVADLAQSLGDGLESLEINPLRVEGDRIEALDGLVSWTVRP